MYNYLFSIPMFIVIIAASAFFAVLGLYKRNPKDRVRKFIPSIVCFVISVNLTFLLIFGWDIILTDFLIMLAAIFFEFVSVIGFFSTLIFAVVLELRDRRERSMRGEEENEKL